MNNALKAIGIIAIIIGIVAGILTGAFFGFLFWLIAGVSIAMILFALCHIIDNQKHISDLLQKQYLSTENLHITYKTCPNCGYEYDDARNSCPNCGKKR